MTYNEVLKSAVSRLKASGVPDFDNDAELLLEHASRKDRARLLLDREEHIPEDERELFEGLLERRISREPLQYILGKWEFMGLEFECSSACLIPRQDTELLVMSALDEIRQQNARGIRLLDLCTGSGCVIISIVKLIEETDPGSVKYISEAVGIDISKDALEIAGRNAKLNSVEIDFRQSDMFEKAGNELYDLITANPPYIETAQIEGLNPEINRFEPMIALDGGEDGLKHYRSIISGAKAHLKNGGMILMEIGDTQGASVSGLLDAAGYRDIEVLKDLAGLDRVVRAMWPGNP